MFNKVILRSLLFVLPLQGFAQCSVCTKTASDLEENAAKGLNAGILYLALLPATIIFIIGYQWYKRQKIS